jgi:nicotinamide mononucleotide transporter
VDNAVSTDSKIAWYSVFKPSWYVDQMKGWSTRSYFLLILGLGLIVGMTIGGGQFNAVTIATLFAGVLGFTCTLSITNAKPLNGVLGLVSALIYIFVAIQAKNFNDVLLQTVYIITLDLPVLLMPSWAKDVDKKVRFLHEKGKGLRNWVLTILFFVVVLAVLYYSDTHWFISPRPWIDSIAATIGITGSLLTTLRFSESYYCGLFRESCQLSSGV